MTRLSRAKCQAQLFYSRTTALGAGKGWRGEPGGGGCIRAKRFKPVNRFALIQQKRDLEGFLPPPHWVMIAVPAFLKSRSPNGWELRVDFWTEIVLISERVGEYSMSFPGEWDREPARCWFIHNFSPFFIIFLRLLRFRDFLNSLKILWWGGHAHSKAEMEVGRAMGIEPTSFTFLLWKVEKEHVWSTRRWSGAEKRVHKSNRDKEVQKGTVRRQH